MDIQGFLNPVDELDIDLDFDLDFETNNGGNKMGNLGDESKKEIGEALQKIKDNEKAFREKMKLETDTDFYFQVVFRSPDELHKFLEEKGIVLQYGDFVFYEDIKHLFK